MKERERVGQQALDAEVEARIEAMNDRLAGLFDDDDDAAAPARPVIFVVGPQRSGSTLVSQVAAVASAVGYPSNLVARFWRSPAAGVWLQRALGRQLGQVASSFASELGTTSGLLEPHEFSYFWNEWWPELRRCRDEAGFLRTLGQLERAFAAPLCFKNVFNTLRVDRLAELVPSSLFVAVRRPLLDVACSTLEARRRRFGSDEAWFGVVPETPDAGEVPSWPVAEQIAWQLFHTEAALAAGLSALAPERVLELDYAAFCADPAQLPAWLETRGIPRRAEAVLPERFAVRSPAATHPDAPALADALRRRFDGSELARAYLP